MSHFLSFSTLYRTDCGPTLMQLHFGEQLQIEVSRNVQPDGVCFHTVHEQNKVINFVKCYCNTEYVVLNSIQLLSTCLQSRYVDQMQYFMLSPSYDLSCVSLCFDQTFHDVVYISNVSPSLFICTFI